MPNNRLDAENARLYEEAKPFFDVYPKYDLAKLPSWVADNIQAARVKGDNRRSLIFPDGSKYHLDNPLNDLSGKEWTLFINSVFTTHYPTSGPESYAHHIRKIHPTPKPPQLMKGLIEFFTKENELVFDPFMGVGGTLLGAALCKRRGAGIDLNSKYIEAYLAAADYLSLRRFPAKHGDSLAVLKDEGAMRLLTGGKPVSLMLFDPPYANMMGKAKTGGDIAVYGKNPTPFTDSEKDLGNMERGEFYSKLRECVELALPFIKFRGYVVLFIKDLQPHKKDINFLHADIASELNKIPDLYYKGMKIWADSSTRNYPYGYPFCFVANQIHQYILIFRKER